MGSCKVDPSISTVRMALHVQAPDDTRSLANVIRQGRPGHLDDMNGFKQLGICGYLLAQ
jgi:hypothetical protein